MYILCLPIFAFALEEEGDTEDINKIYKKAYIQALNEESNPLAMLGRIE